MSSKHYRAQRMYESVVVFKPTLTEDEYNTKLNEVKDFIAKKGGSIVHEEDWGTKNLAYTSTFFGYEVFHFI